MNDQKKISISDLQKEFLKAEADSATEDAARAVTEVLEEGKASAFSYDYKDPEEILIAGVCGPASGCASGACAGGGPAVSLPAKSSGPSDRRLKMNVMTLTDTLERLKKIRGVEYEWVDKESRGFGRQIGFIAQELEEVFPEVVNSDKVSGLKSVSYELLVAPIAEAVKELAQRNIELEIRLKNLERVLNRQELSPRLQRDDEL